MKTIKLFLTITLIGLGGLFFTQCSDDDPTPTAMYSISGTATYPEFTGNAVVAPGAVLYLQVEGTGASTNYDMSAIADGSGNYSFGNLLPGSYFIFASYNSNNTNVPNGRYDDMLFYTGTGYTVEVINTDVTQAIALETVAETGTVSFNTNLYDGTTNPYETRFDGTHSNIVFGFPFDAGNAEFIGQFTGFDVDVKFNQANLSSSAITATIDLTTVDTGQPGRDTGCIQESFAVVDDLGVPTGNDEATFTSTSIEKYGNGYLAKGNMTFHGNTDNVNLFFTYEPGFEATNSSDVTTEYSSFKGTFEFAALDAFGIESSHVLDATVTVYVSIQLRRTIE